MKTNDVINILIFHKFSLTISLSSLITFHGTQRVQVKGKLWAICEKKRRQRDSKKENSIFYKWPQSFVTLQSKTACVDKVARKVWYWQLLDKGRRYRGWCDASPCIVAWWVGGEGAQIAVDNQVPNYLIVGLLWCSRFIIFYTARVISLTTHILVQFKVF